MSQGRKDKREIKSKSKGANRDRDEHDRAGPKQQSTPKLLVKRRTDTDLGAEAASWQIERDIDTFIQQFVTSCVNAQVKESVGFIQTSDPEPVVLFNQSSPEVQESVCRASVKGVTILTKIVEKDSRANFDNLCRLFSFFMDKLPDLYLRSTAPDGSTMLFKQLQECTRTRDLWLQYLATRYPEQVAVLMKREAHGKVAGAVLDAIRAKPPPLATLQLLFPPAGGRLPAGSGPSESQPATATSVPWNPHPNPLNNEPEAPAIDPAMTLLHRAAQYDPDSKSIKLDPVDDSDESESETDRGDCEYEEESEGDGEEDLEGDEQGARLEFGEENGKECSEVGDDEEASIDRRTGHMNNSYNGSVAIARYINSSHDQGTAMAPPLDTEEGRNRNKLAPVIGTQLELVQTVFQWLPEAIEYCVSYGELSCSPYQYRVSTYGHEEWQNTLSSLSAELLAHLIEWADSDAIAHFLKDQVIRRCETDAATALLHIKGTQERAIHLDLAEMEHRDYSVSAQALNHLLDTLHFDTVLRYVQISWHMCAKTGTETSQDVESQSKAGTGRQDFKHVFRKLRQLQVRKILRIVVTDDEINPHTDDSIEQLRPFEIEVFDWNRQDICSSVLAKACSDVHELFLYSSGNNAVLRSWSETEGLAQLKRLETLHLTVWRQQESEQRTNDYIEQFKARMKNNHPNPVEIHSTIIQRKKSPNDQSRAVIPDGELANAWLENMSKFVKFVKTIPDPKDEKWPGVRVAVIDDGTEIMKGTEFRGNIRDGRSFCTKQSKSHSRTAPYYFSTSGHGTVMAQYILKMCPKAHLYIARLDHGSSPSNRLQPTIESAARAILWAIDKEVHIISMSWTMTKTRENEAEFTELLSALKCAADKGILMFGAASDEGFNLGDEIVPFPAKAPGIICIGAAKRSGHGQGVAQKDADFFFPGANLDSPPPPAWASGASLGEYKRPQQYISGSSFATALASGLTALLLYCVDVAIELAGEPCPQDRLKDPPYVPQIKSEHRKQLQNHMTLTRVFEEMCKSKEHGVQYIPVSQFFSASFEKRSWRSMQDREEFYSDLEQIIRPVMDEVKRANRKR